MGRHKLGYNHGQVAPLTLFLHAIDVFEQWPQDRPVGRLQDDQRDFRLPLRPLHPQLRGLRGVQIHGQRGYVG